jgi:hypothetical protein
VLADIAATDIIEVVNPGGRGSGPPRDISAAMYVMPLAQLVGAA